MGNGADRHRACPKRSLIRGSFPRWMHCSAAIEAAPAASGWGAALVRYELLLLAELGFGLDLDSCAVSGATDNLVAVSPRSGRAVSAAEAEPYAGKLLPLPRFVREGGQASWSDIAAGLDLTGHFLMRDCADPEIGGARRSARAAGRPAAAGGRIGLVSHIVCAPALA